VSGLQLEACQLGYEVEFGWPDAVMLPGSQVRELSSSPTLDHKRAVHSGIWFAGWWREVAGLL
jgi:hypothetical protein